MKSINRESGQTLVMVALSLTALLGFTALATDVGTLLHQRRIAQAAADSAAIAGATAALGVQNGAGAETVATTAGQLDASYYGFSSSEVTINTPPTDDINSAFNNPGYVEAIVTETMTTPIITTFVHLVNPSSTYNGMTVKARAVATDTIASGGCGRVNDKADYDPAADLGGHSLLASATCSFEVDGNLAMSGSSKITGDQLNVTGGINYTGNASSVPSNTQTSATATSDPQQYLNWNQNLTTGPTSPTPGGSCTSPTGTGTCYYDYQNANLSGDLKPGVYYFDEDVHILGSLTSNEGGVTIFMNGTHAFDFENNGTINLSAPQPASGSGCSGNANPYCGILIDAPNDVASNNACLTGAGRNGGNNPTQGTIYFDFGSSSTSFEGAIYAPQAHMFLQDQGASVTMTSYIDIGTLCQQSANITIAGQTADNPNTRVGLVE